MSSPQKAKAVVLVDNPYLNKILKFQFNESRFDYLKFSEEATEGYWRLRTYVYDCLPYQSNPPTTLEKQMLASSQKFFSTLRRLPSFEVRFGRLRPRQEGGFVQKGLDVLFAIDLIKLSLKAQIQKAILVTGDADYAPAIQVAKDEGVSITLYHASNEAKMQGERFTGFSNALWDLCDERRVIDQALIDRCRYIPVSAPRFRGRS